MNAVFESTAKTLAEDGRIEIRGFGTFKMKEYEEYIGRKPKTGELITVASKKLPVFRVGRELKERVNSKTGEGV